MISIKSPVRSNEPYFDQICIVATSQGFKVQKTQTGAVVFLKKEGQKYIIPPVLSGRSLYIEAEETADPERGIYTVVGTSTGEKLRPFYITYTCNPNRFVTQARFTAEDSLVSVTANTAGSALITDHSLVIRADQSWILHKEIWRNNGMIRSVPPRPFVEILDAAIKKSQCQNCCCVHYGDLTNMRT